MLCALKLQKYVDARTLSRISGVCLDFLVVAAVSSIRLDVIVDHAMSMLLISIAALASMLFYFYWLAPRVFSEDWFEQAIVHFGVNTGVTALMKAGFDTLVEAGYQPENAYFECIHEMKLIVDLIFAHGFAGMRYSISNTAEYGDYEIGQRLITEETKKEMKKVLTEIQDGTFARNWLLENQSGCVHFLAKRRIEAGSQLEEVGKDLRGKMSWGTKVEEL